MMSRRAFGRRLAGAFGALMIGCRRRTSAERSAFHPEGLAHAAGALRAAVDKGDLPGVVTLLSRGGETHVEAVGLRDIASREPMTRDTIFRIASMTKPVTAAAAMLLVEDGTLALDAPVDRWLPELANRRVLRTLESPLNDTVPAQRPITLHDLLTMRMGLGVVFADPKSAPIVRAMMDAGVAPGPELFGEPPDEFMHRLGGLPLVAHPGERWLYHTGLDVAGVLLARAAGTTLGQVLRERIFDPLGMADTGFFVPEAKVGRLATCYARDRATRKLVVWDKTEGGKFASAPAFEAGGGGLVSTVDDYRKFARMLAEGGTAGQERLLSASSVAEMTRDQIPAAQKAASPFYPGFWDNRGWGLGLSIMTGPDDVTATPGRFGWDGGYGTTFIAHPAKDLVAILLAQRLMVAPDDTATNEAFLKGAYAAVG